MAFFMCPSSSFQHAHWFGAPPSFDDCPRRPGEAPGVTFAPTLGSPGVEKGWGDMATAVLFIGWDRPRPGREGEAFKFLMGEGQETLAKFQKQGFFERTERIA